MVLDFEVTELMENDIVDTVPWGLYQHQVECDPAGGGMTSPAADHLADNQIGHRYALSLYLLMTGQKALLKHDPCMGAIPVGK